MSEIFSTKLAEGGDARTHLDTLRNKQERLLNAGDGLSDRIFSFAMLQSLPPSYDTVTTPLYQLDPIIPDYIIKVIIREYDRRPKSGFGTESASALAADATGKGKKTYNKERTKITNPCPNHPKGNHTADKCHLKLQKDLEDAQSKLKDMGWKAVGVGSTAAVARSGMGEDGAEAIYGYCAMVETLALVGVVEGQVFHIDSGASHHMVTDPTNLQNMVPINKHQIHTGGRNTVRATHKGTIEVGTLLLKDVLYAPDLGFNLISVYRLAELGYKTVFEEGHCKIQDPDGKTVLTSLFDGLYNVKASSSTSLVAKSRSADSLLYHHRSYAHLNFGDLRGLAQTGRLGEEWIDAVPSKDVDVLCEPCILGKGTKKSSPPSDVHADEANGLVHYDGWGPATIPSQGGSRDILTCYDDFTHRYLALVANQCDTHVKMVRTDNGGEFTSRAFVEMLGTKGIIPIPIPPGAHAQNGRVERVHRTIFDAVRTVLVDSRLPPEFWSEAANYAAYVRNRVPKTGTTDSARAVDGKEVRTYTNAPFWIDRLCARSHLSQQARTEVLQGHVDRLPVLQ